LSDTQRKRERRLCRDCETQLPPTNPYKRRCIRCAVKVREYVRKRMGARPWSECREGRQPLCPDTSDGLSGAAAADTPLPVGVSVRVSA